MAQTCLIVGIAEAVDFLYIARQRFGKNILTLYPVGMDGAVCSIDACFDAFDVVECDGAGEAGLGFEFEEGVAGKDS